MDLTNREEEELTELLNLLKEVARGRGVRVGIERDCRVGDGGKYELSR